MIKFSILTAFRRKGVSLLAILGVGLGSGLLATLLSLSEGIEGRFNQAFQQVSGTISITSEEGNVLGRMLGTVGDPLPKSYVEKIAEVEGVEIVFPYVVAQIPMSVLPTPTFMGVGLTGIGEDGEELLGSPNQNIIEGRSFEEEKEIIAGKHMITDSKFLGEEIKVGDKFEVPLGKTDEVIELTIAGIFETGNAVNDYAFIGKESLARKISQLSKDKISGILVQAKDPSQVSEIATQIEDLFKKKKTKVSAVVPTDILEQLNSFLGVFRSFLLAIALVAAIAGGMAVMVVMLLTGHERRREFGILKASGWSNGNIIFSVLITSLTLALLGVLIGLGLGAGAAVRIGSYIESPEFVTFNQDVFIWALGVGLVTGLVGGILPAINAARVSPIETLRSE